MKYLIEIETRLELPDPATLMSYLMHLRENGWTFEEVEQITLKGVHVRTSNENGTKSVTTTRLTTVWRAS